MAAKSGSVSRSVSVMIQSSKGVLPGSTGFYRVQPGSAAAENLVELSCESRQSRSVERNVVDEPRPPGAGRNDKGRLAIEASHLYIVYLQGGYLGPSRGDGVGAGGMCG